MLSQWEGARGGEVGWRGREGASNEEEKRGVASQRRAEIGSSTRRCRERHLLFIG